MISSTYLPTVALHAAVLSVLASAALLVIRQARYRSVIAICGLLAVGILPWITALRPTPAAVVVSKEMPAAPTPTALPVWTVVTLPAEMSATTAPVSHTVNAPVAFSFPDLLNSAIALWAAGSTAGLLLLGIAWLRQRHWTNTLEAIDGTSWARLQEMGSPLPDRNTFLLTSSTASPCVIGFRHPRVVLPRFIFTDDSDTALVWAIRHELSHLRAGDSRWMLVLSLVRCLYWWNPLVHHLGSRWAAAREQLCDLAAADVSATRGDYGKFLVTMAGQINHRSPLTVAMARRAPARRLKSRIVSLLDAKPGAEKPVGRQFVGLSLVGFVAIGVMVSVLSIRAEDAAVEKDSVVQIPVQEKQPEPPPESKSSSTAVTDVNPEPAAVVHKSGVIQIKTTTRFVATKGELFPPDQTLLSDGQQKMIMRRLAEAKGTYLMTAPRMTSLSGQKGAVEIIREVLGTREQASLRKPGSTVPFVGIKLDLKTTLLDGGLAELDLTMSYRFIPNVFQPIYETGPYKALPAETNPDDIKILERTASVRLESRMAIGITLGEIEPGLFYYMFTTVESIDEKGRPTVGFEDDTVQQEKRNIGSEIHRIAPSVFSRPHDSRPEGSMPTENVEGKLRLSGEYVEFPHREGGQIPQEPIIQLVPSTSEISKTIISQRGAMIRKLKAVEVPLDEVATPWAEFPGLKLTAMASRDFKWITISSLPVGEGKEVEGLANMWPCLANGSVMNFCLKPADPKLERRLLIRLDAVK